MSGSGFFLDKKMDETRLMIWLAPIALVVLERVGTFSIAGSNGIGAEDLMDSF